MAVNGADIDINFHFQKIKQSTERQRELENEHVKAISRLNNSGQNLIEDVPTLQVRPGRFS